MLGSRRQAAQFFALLCQMPRQRCVDIIEQGISKGLELVGRQFEDGTYFLADLVMAGEVVKEAIRATWKYFNLSSFFAYNELLVASRTDQGLAKIFYPQQKMFEQQFFETVKAIYPLWGNMGQALELGSDVVFLTMQGMATSFMRYHKKERVEHILEYLEKQVIDIYESREI